VAPTGVTPVRADSVVRKQVSATFDRADLLTLWVDCPAEAVGERAAGAPSRWRLRGGAFRLQQGLAAPGAGPGHLTDVGGLGASACAIA
jgi:hypothetical protein